MKELIIKADEEKMDIEGNALVIKRCYRCKEAKEIQPGWYVHYCRNYTPKSVPKVLEEAVDQIYLMEEILET